MMQAQVCHRTAESGAGRFSRLTRDEATCGWALIGCHHRVRTTHVAMSKVLRFEQRNLLSLNFCSPSHKSVESPPSRFNSSPRWHASCGELASSGGRTV
ncbi:hypothetical protein RRG08_049222 [Elysia crispata]|uniref:Uncharacterized protein n=1 Tax=Elysia crispata TaxID=231223 RepID=A0AAE0YVC5_9GAST|nr:hypothetical protein RRG08_049222 [Elysia crispata]